MLKWGIEGVAWLQSLMGMEWKTLMLIFSKGIGDAPGYILVLFFFYYVLDRTMGLRLFVMLGLADALNNLLKNIIAAQRPFQVDDRITMRIAEDGYGFPSGHAQLSGTVYGRLLFVKKNVLLPVILILILLGIGLSRLYLGLHTPEQVFAGWLLAALFLWLSFKYETPLVNSIKKWSFIGVFFVFTTSALIFSGIVMAITFLGEVPADSQGRFDLIKHAIQGSALASGSIIGGWKLWKTGGWELPRSLPKRWLSWLLTVLITVILVMVIEDALLDSLQSLTALCSVAFVSRFLLGYLATFILPRFYKILKLS